MYPALMTSQRMLPFRSGRHVRFARHLGVLFGQARDLFWSDGPSCLVRRSYDSAELVRESPGCMTPIRLSASSHGPRLMGLAVPRNSDGLVIVHEHPHGARLVTQRGKELVAERIWPEEHVDVAIATNGRQIVVSESRRAELSCYAEWSLGSPTTWSLAPVRRALGGVRLNVVGLRDLGDSLLIWTPDTWSRWSWDQALLACWPTPASAGWGPYLVAWHEDGPVLHMQTPAPQAGPASGRPSLERDAWHLVVWDLRSGAGRSLGAAYGWPRAARSPDGRWLLADRVSQTGRGLELWDLATGALVERLSSRRRAVQALAFAPDSRHVALATMQDFFVMRIEV